MLTQTTNRMLMMHKYYESKYWFIFLVVRSSIGLLNIYWLKLHQHHRVFDLRNIWASNYWNGRRYLQMYPVYVSMLIRSVDIWGKFEELSFVRITTLLSRAKQEDLVWTLPTVDSKGQCILLLHYRRKSIDV